MTVSDDDIWRSAKLIVDQYGPGAWIYAATRVRELQEKRDGDGAATWLRIAEAIAKLDDMKESIAVH